VAAVFPAVAHRPSHIVKVGGQLWVSGASRPLVRLDALTGRHRVRGPSADAISVAGATVWVADRLRRELVTVARRAPRRVSRRIALPAIPVAVAADPRGGAWVGVDQPLFNGPGAVLHYDASGRLLGQTPVAGGVNAVQLAPASVWVAEHNAPSLLRIDRRTGQVRASKGLISPAGWLAYGGGSVWATLPERDTIARIRPHLAPVYGAAGRQPENLTYARGRVYVASRLDQALWVIDPKTMKPAQPALPMRLNPFAVASDGRHVWVTSLGDGTVTRVDL
jgi:streptogramin lyase